MSDVPIGGRRSNLEIIFADWLDAMRRNDFELMSACLAPDVAHHGVRADLVCRGRDAVLERLHARGGRLLRVSAVELVEVGDHVVMSVRAPSVGVPMDADGPPRGQATIAFTMRDGLIVAMQDYVTRAAALAAAGRSGHDVWE